MHTFSFENLLFHPTVSKTVMCMAIYPNIISYNTKYHNTNLHSNTHTFDWPISNALQTFACRIVAATSQQISLSHFCLVVLSLTKSAKRCRLATLLISKGRLVVLL